MTMSETKRLDAFGKELQVGDKVVFNEKMNGRLYLGTIVKFTTCKAMIMTPFDGIFTGTIYKNCNRIALYDREH